ncbi:MAG: LacI family DNA-binding transcriptional regulator [Chloroflexota bacterium]
MVYIKDVAREAGVSVATVSRVVANTGYPVRPETRRRVLEAVERLGYRPNSLARSLRVGRSGVVGLCATTISNPTVISAVEGIIGVCRSVDRQVQLTATFWDAAEEIRHLQLFLQERMAGVISYPSGAPAEYYLQLQRAGTPVVLINRGVPGLVAPIVRYDFAGGYAKVVASLAERGHRRIGVVLPGSGVERQYHAGLWRAAFERAGLTPADDLVRQGPVDLVTAEGYSSHGAYVAVRDLLESSSRPTALLAGSVTFTLAAIRAIDDAGLRVPDDVALVGTGDQRWELLFTPRIPLLCLDSFSLGTQAAEILNDLIDNPEKVQVGSEVLVSVSLENAEVGSSPSRV